MEVSLFFLLDGGDIGPISSYDNSAVSIVVSIALGPLRFAEPGVRAGVRVLDGVSGGCIG